MNHTQLLTGWPLWLAVIALNFANAVASMDTWSLAFISAAVAKDLKAQDTISWAATSALVAATIGQCLLGYLSNVFGRRPMLYIALGLFVVGSALCGASHFVGSAPFYYFGRAVTGCAVGSISNLVNIAQSDFLTTQQRRRYQGVQGASVAVGSLTGLLVAAALVANGSDPRTGWPMQYWLQMVLGANSFALIMLCVPSPPARPSGQRISVWSFDWAGIISGTGAIVPVLIIATEGARFGWRSATTIALLICFSICSVLFVCLGCLEPFNERFGTQPVIPFRLFKNGAIRVILFQCLCSGMAFYVFVIYGPRYLETFTNQTKLQAAAWMAFYVVTHGTWSSLSPFVIEMLDRKMKRKAPNVQSYRDIAAFSFLVWTIAMLSWSVIPGPAPLAVLIIFCIMVGIGAGGVFQNSVNVIRSQVTAEDMASATSSRNVVRYLGGGISTAFVRPIIQRMRLQSLPSRLHSYADQTFSKADDAHLSSADLVYLKAADLAGYKGALGLACAAAGLGMLVCLFLYIGKWSVSKAYDEQTDGIELSDEETLRIDSGLEMQSDRSSDHESTAKTNQVA
ncbi:hypothetical protein LTR10_013856 [Elasticomyces elasticus]|nr:hypothetical protein LTR10_013856 [Elasticomyces elasticus]KAK4974561.1 hypothetical protein LTR42_005206 [Elasticomyces elasticus]